MATFTITNQSGRVVNFANLNLLDAIKVTSGDGVLGGQLARSMILTRTAKHVDVNEAKFHPYSTKGPYYYYPTGRGARGKLSAGQRRAQRSRVAGKALSGRGKGRPTSLGIRFNSYADFKRQLGRSGVDLTGPRAPHMLQAMVVKAGTATVAGNATGQESNTQPIGSFEVGFYGEEAARARGHNEGAGHLPKRRFFAVSPKELQKITDLIGLRMQVRLRAAMNK